MKYALRSLARHRSFTATVVLTLSVGIGATTTICSVVKTVLLQPLPLDDATFAIVALAFAAVAAMASYVPARRATRIDPMEALRID